MIDLAELRRVVMAGSGDGLLAFSPSDLLALVEAVEAARAFLEQLVDPDGTEEEDEAYREELRAALAPFGAVREPGGDQ